MCRWLLMLTSCSICEQRMGAQGFIVEKGTKGLEIGEREKNMGIRALATYELDLKDCQVPNENRLGGDKGCDFNRIINRSRVALSAMAVGVARRPSSIQGIMPRSVLPSASPLPHARLSLLCWQRWPSR